MKRRKPTALVLMVLVCCAISVGKPIGRAEPQKSKALHHVKKIQIVQSGLNIVKTQDAYGQRLMTNDQANEHLKKAEARDKRMVSLLKAELEKAGFVVVDDKKDAEAVLVGMTAPTVVNHPEPRRYVYKLMSPAHENFLDFIAGKGKLWETEIKINSSPIEDESDKKAAVMTAEKLLKKWLKSAKEAGLSTGDKVQ